ncbi:MAG: class E sortase [Rubrobacteraceae bacterium]
MRTKRIVSGVASVLLVAAGLTLLAFYFLNPGSENTATNSKDPKGFNVPEISNTQGSAQEASGPADKTLKVTIPAMSRVKDANVPDAVGDDEAALKANAAIHLKGTGFPWQQEANVYLAGHRLGYPNTDSFLAFWDLNKLKNGDKAFVTDADGTEYTYKVFKNFIVGPSEMYVTEPVPGRNILTLQTCTLPDYSKRLIVQAELVDKKT